ncbi:MAG: response regulator transcription factor [Paraglaciecola sp.]|uniref:LytR/AlgR family response regulator transcription factor n=1 Tax=Paraglaciecola sp. TaxID=1920173 RepID=UPI003297557B
MKIIIIDDEPLAHEVLLHHLQQHNDIRVVQQCYNATDALAYLAHHNVDLILSDIKMPGLSGLDMLKVMGNRPQVVLCTAFQEHALVGFELDVTDYLLKPISLERLTQALEKVKLRMQKVVHKVERKSFIIRVDREDRKVWLDTIECFESYGNYVKVWQDKNYVLTQGPLKEISQALPQGDFIQIHKSVLVNKADIIAKDTHTLTLTSGRKVNIGKSFKAKVADLWNS